MIDVRRFAAWGLVDTELPEFEADDGIPLFCVTWRHGYDSFGLTFFGAGQVIGVLSPLRHSHPSWKLSVYDEAGLREKLADPVVAAIVSQKSQSVWLR